MAARKKKGEELAIGALRIPMADRHDRLRRIECTCTDDRIDSIDLFLEKKSITVIVYSKSGTMLPNQEQPMGSKMRQTFLPVPVADLSDARVQTLLAQHVDDVLKIARRCYCVDCLEENETSALRAQIAKANEIKLTDADADARIDALLKEET